MSNNILSGWIETLLILVLLENVNINGNGNCLGQMEFIGYGSVDSMVFLLT